MQYVDVALARRTGTRETLLTYTIPPELLASIQVGSMVEVPFHRFQELGIVTRFRRTLAESALHTKLRPVRRVISPWPVLSPLDLAFRIALADQTAAPRSLALTLALPPRSILKQLPPPAASETLRISRQDYEIAAATAPFHHLLPQIEATLAKNLSVCFIVPTIEALRAAQKIWQELLPDQSLTHRSGAKIVDQLPLWKTVYGHQARLVLGTRRALLLPFRRLGLIVIEQIGHPQLREEQAPYYEALALARLRISLFGGTLIARSSLPPFELLGGSERRRWHFFRRQPALATIAVRKRPTQGLLSPGTEATIANAVAAGERVLLVVKNKGGGRGQICGDCGRVQRCSRCQTIVPPLTPSASSDCLGCQMPQKSNALCATCGGSNLKIFGWGTERWAEKLTQRLPGVQISAMSATGLIPKKWQLLIVAPSWLHLPPIVAAHIIAVEPEQFLFGTNFALQEEWYRFLLELRNRATRRFVIETTIPELPFFRELTNLVPTATIRAALKERRENSYPPYGDLIEITLTAATAKLTHLAERLTKVVGAHLPELQLQGPQLVGTDVAKNTTSYRYLGKVTEKTSVAAIRALARELPHGARLIVSGRSFH